VGCVRESCGGRFLCRRRSRARPFQSSGVQGDHPAGRPPWRAPVSPNIAPPLVDRDWACPLGPRGADPRRGRGGGGRGPSTISNTPRPGAVGGADVVRAGAFSARTSRFSPDLPEISIDLNLSDQVIDLVAGGFDLALRIAALSDSSTIARHLCQVRRLLVGAPSYFASRERPSHPRELSRHACLGYSYLPSGDSWRFIGSAGEDTPSP
jgi:LysR substrate binding domain